MHPARVASVKQRVLRADTRQLASHLGRVLASDSPAEVLRHIYESRDFTKIYALRAALVRNPKVPLPTALKFLPTLQEKDIKELARDRNVPATVQAQAKSWVLKREQASKGPAGGKNS
jgi:hypothetical protein